MKFSYGIVGFCMLVDNLDFVMFCMGLLVVLCLKVKDG